MQSILYQVVEIILFIIRWLPTLMFIYFLMSWFPGARESKIGQFLARIFEPILEPFRRIIPPIGMFDISSLVAYFIFQYAMRVLTGLIQVYVIPILF
ncbi:YggT family protein [Listeria monocytogenes]|nr:YggT family protein [Listeria monocytogenes]EDN7483995.1 YggT family protein [Listeria monocytogenes]EDO1037978.1 YggT family protein [Listeria monocytogenes]EDO1086980.1 YggT family protein [Listeria monocytogenes]EDO1133702.1 YggT family protein [Listeria monocytogenes]